MKIQAVQMPRQALAQLRPLRTLAGLEIHEAGDQLWLRVSEESDAIQTAVKCLPAATMYQVLEDGGLCRAGSLVPRGFLPEGPWTKLRDWMQIELPPASLPGRIARRALLKLVRESRPRQANMLLTSIEHWLNYGENAPQVRLDCWRFAVSAGGEVLIRGVPLPPLPGKHFVEEHGIAVPSGWGWSPAVDADLIAKVFPASRRGLVLWREDGTFERIAEEQFVRATRSAIRLSSEAPADV